MKMWKSCCDVVPQPFLCVHRADLHGHSVLHQHRSQLSVQLEEDLSLTRLVQVTECQRLYVEGLSSLQLHLKLKGKEKKKQEGGRDRNEDGRGIPTQVTETSSLNNIHCILNIDLDR